MNSLEGKRALVTAGGQGIGLATLKRLREAGCSVALHYFSSAPETAAWYHHGDHPAPVALQADLTKEGEAKRLVEEAAEALGGLDILVNNAGSLIARRSLGEVDAEFWRESIDLNVTSMLWVTQAALPYLVEAGGSGGASIVNLASLAGRKGGHPGSLVYSTAKGAILTWTRALATELAPHGIRVNAVAPGFILGTSFHATHTTEASAKATIEAIPLGRAGNPDDVARAVVYLASEYSGFITGATLDINGGVYSA